MSELEKFMVSELANRFGAPCDYHSTDGRNFMFEHNGKWCDEYCDSGHFEECWRKYFETQYKINQPQEVKIRNLLIDEGQSNSKKYGFKLGETIKFDPAQVEEILARRKKEWQ